MLSQLWQKSATKKRLKMKTNCCRPDKKGDFERRQRHETMTNVADGRQTDRQAGRQGCSRRQQNVIIHRQIYQGAGRTDTRPLAYLPSLFIVLSYL